MSITQVNLIIVLVAAQKWTCEVGKWIEKKFLQPLQIAFAEIGTKNMAALKIALV